MATGGATSLPQAETQDDSLTCPMCLEIFNCPKILPCFHTFCEACLKTLAGGHPGGRFPCPSCREDVQVPSGGVSAFRNNLYIKPEDLEKARNGLLCAVHPKRELELFCVTCEHCICFMCKNTEHDTHKTEDVQKAAKKAKAQLSDDLTRVTQAVLDTKRRMGEVPEEQTALKKKTEVVEQDIRNRHATVVATADRLRDTALDSLTTATGRMDTKLTKHLTAMQRSLTELLKLQKQLEESKHSASIIDILKVAKKMKDGPANEAALKKLIPKPMSAVSRPVLRSSDTAKATVGGMREFMGTVVQVDMQLSVPEVSVKEQVHCGQQRPNCEAFSLCPFEDESLWVCYSASDFDAKYQSPEKFSRDGKIVATQNEGTAEMTYKFADGVGLCLFQTKTEFKTYVKSSKFIQLVNNLHRRIEVQKINVISNDPLKANTETEFTINCGRHRACDTNGSGQFFVVVEEGKPPDTRRKVRLFQRPRAHAVDLYSFIYQPYHSFEDDPYNPPAQLNESFEDDPYSHQAQPYESFEDDPYNHQAQLNESFEDDPYNHQAQPYESFGATGYNPPAPYQPRALATYTPPAQPFQPSDVCFYQLGGREVLLVADQLNDAIHVVHVHGGGLRFLRYLAPGCPLLLQPTALNLDSQGRLWVACRGGSILRCQPL